MRLVVESVEPTLDISLNSFTSCPVSVSPGPVSWAGRCQELNGPTVQNFDNHISEFYASPPFMAEATEAAPFLEQLQPYLGNRSINFTNMVRPSNFAHDSH